MGIVVIGAVFVDIKGHPLMQYIPAGRNVGRVMQVHGGVARNIAEDIANVELRPTFVSVVDESGIGEDVINKLSKHKVNVDYMRKNDFNNYFLDRAIAILDAIEKTTGKTISGRDSDSVIRDFGGSLAKGNK